MKAALETLVKRYTASEEELQPIQGAYFGRRGELYNYARSTKDLLTGQRGRDAIRKRNRPRNPEPSRDLYYFRNFNENNAGHF